MMNDKLFALISKYAVLLSILYAVSYGFDLTINSLDFGDDPSVNAYSYAGFPPLFNFLLNIVAALVVQRDINKHKIKTNGVILATVLYRPIGIVVFLLYLILQQTSPKQLGTDSTNVS